MLDSMSIISMGEKRKSEKERHSRRFVSFFPFCLLADGSGSVDRVEI